MTFIAHDQPPEIAQPGKQALNLPTPLVPPQFATILRLRPSPVATMRSNHLDAPFRQTPVQPVTVIGTVSDQPLRQVWGETCLQRSFDQGHFMRASTCDGYGDRKTSAVCHCHELRTFAPLGLSHPEAPFFATTKVPSMKHSSRSKPPLSFRSLASARKISSMTPMRTHRWKRRWQVWYGGYRSGKSFQGAPVRSIQRIPLSTSRGERHGRPRLGFGTLSPSGISGSMMAHCSSVRSIVLTPHRKDQHYYITEANL